MTKIQYSNYEVKNLISKFAFKFNLYRYAAELQIRTADMHRMAECGIAADGEVKVAWRTMVGG